MTFPPKLGTTSIFSPEATKGAVTKELDTLEQGEAEAQVEATTDGAVEASVNVPMQKGLTFTAFAKAPITSLKQAVAGFRLTKKFGRK